MTGKRTSLDCIFKPRSIAVIGASRRKGAIGRELLHNLLQYEYNGKVFPVNPSADVIHSMKAYDTILGIYDEIDLAIIILPKQFVPQALEDCGRKGVKGAVVISAGFREVGEEGLRREQELIAICDRYDMRMVGPNCMGIVNTHPDVYMNATFAPTPPLRGNMAFLSQSGAMGVAILQHAGEMNLGYSMFCSMGNKADVNTIDLLEYWEEDPDTDVILMYLESFGDPRHFTSLAKRIVKKKPILCVKSGRTLAGARAAVSHTGAMAGLDVAADALFEHTGIIRVGTVEDLFDVAMAFSSQPLPKGDRVAILTDAGGPAIMATDAVVSSGMTIAELSEETRAALEAILPEEASVQNPVDMLGHCTEDHYLQALPMLLKDPGVDAVIALYVPPVIHDPMKVAEAIFAGAEGSDKPVLCVFMAHEEVMKKIKEKGNRVPVYEFPESAVRALAQMRKYAVHKERDLGEIPDLDVDYDRARKVFDTALGEGRDYLTSMEGFDVLDAYGIPLAAWKLCEGPDDAAAFAEECGLPVVVKLMSPTISHKSDYGGVVVDLRTAEDVRKAVSTIQARVAEADEEIVIDGFLVQQMVRGGKEVILGLATDPVFGPLLMFGMGGIYVEVLKDVSFRLVPVTDVEVREMVRSIRAWPLLRGVRGEEGVKTEAVEDALLRVSRLVQDFHRVVEFDINPFIAHQDPNLCRAVDVRFRLKAALIDPDLIIARPSGTEGPVLAMLTMAADTGPPVFDDLDQRLVLLKTGLRGGAIRILGDPETEKGPELLAAAGRAIAACEGPIHLIPGPGLAPEDMLVVHEENSFVLGLPRELGGSGDPSPFTALGAYAAIGACTGPLRGVRIAVQGVGRVGAALARLLAEGGARLTVADLDMGRAHEIAREVGAEVVSPDAIFETECEVFSPNARGVVFDDESIPRLRCRYVAGAASGQIGEPRHAEALANRGIAYVPERIAGSGWLLGMVSELSEGGFQESTARDTVMRIAVFAKSLLLSGGE